MTTEATPVDAFLARRGATTAVEEFSARHDAGLLDPAVRSYRDLLPLEAPGPGQQYAFDVSLDSCTGCKACVTACHSVNGLDEGESFRSVGLLVGGSAAQPIQQSVTTACHHCVEPACLHGCPANAFTKDPATGIVAHLEGRCLGCGYCTWTCPYEVPRFNKARGVVRKCDMCASRLGAGEAPACAEACPNSAIRITVVDTAAFVEAAPRHPLLPGAPPSTLTIPTTTFRSYWGLPTGLVAADYHSVAPAHPHHPLTVLLVLTQVAVGVSVAGLVSASGRSPAAVGVALVLALLGLVASVTHLGRPRRALGALRNLRRSWLSREVAAFGAFAAAAVLHAATGWTVLAPVMAAAGVAGVVSSAMLYAATRRPLWRLARTGPRFALTSVVGGLAVIVATGGRGVAPVLALAMAGKLVWEASVFRHRGSPRLTDVARTARLLAGPLRATTVWRFALGVSGGIAVPLALAAGADLPGAVAAAAAAAVVVGELLERHQFFAAVTWPGMPGPLQ